MSCIMLVLMLADVTRGCSVVTRADITGVGLIRDNMTSSHSRDTVMTPCHECHGPELVLVTITDLGTMSSCILSTLTRVQDITQGKYCDSGNNPRYNIAHVSLKNHNVILITSLKLECLVLR